MKKISLVLVLLSISLSVQAKSQRFLDCQLNRSENLIVDVDKMEGSVIVTKWNFAEPTPDFVTTNAQMTVRESKTQENVAKNIKLDMGRSGSIDLSLGELGKDQIQPTIVTANLMEMSGQNRHVACKADYSVLNRNIAMKNVTWKDSKSDTTSNQKDTFTCKLGANAFKLSPSNSEIPIPVGACGRDVDSIELYDLYLGKSLEPITGYVCISDVHFIFHSLSSRKASAHIYLDELDQTSLTLDGKESKEPYVCTSALSRLSANQNGDSKTMEVRLGQ